MKDDKPHWEGRGNGASAIGSSTSVVNTRSQAGELPATLLWLIRTSTSVW